MEHSNAGQILKEIREKAGISQRQLSISTGVDRGYISKLEADKGGGLSLRTAKLLADALNVDPGVFFGSVEQTRKPAETPEQILDRLRLAQPVSIPVYTNYPVHAGDPVEPIEYVYRARAKSASKNIEGYLVKGTCLEPDIRDGDVIVINREGHIDDGDIIACVIGDELHLGRLRKIAGELYLENNNTRYKFEECMMAAPVIEVIRRLK